MQTLFLDPPRRKHYNRIMPKPVPLTHVALSDRRPRQTEAQEDDLFTMSNLRWDLTGLPENMVVWISPRADNRHDARVKVSRGSKYRKDQVVSVSLRPTVEVKGGLWKFSAKDFERLKEWITLNRQALVDYWEERIEYDDDVKALLKKLP
jgi:hypothetical protein